MFSVEEATRRILGSVREVDIEHIDLVDGLNRTLAEAVVASTELPPFSRATVDGFAIQSGDAKHASQEEGALLRVIETVQAGSVPTQTVEPGTAIRIMTGAPLPHGADTVAKKEETVSAANKTDSIQVRKPLAPMENVASAGEEVRTGDVVLQKRTILRPEAMGVLASLGLRQIAVFRRPVIALLSTGSELVDLGDNTEAGKIFASSFYVLLAKIREAGCTPLSLGVVRDERADIQERIRSGKAADGIITVGGTRHGDSDWVRDVYQQMDIDLRVDGVAMSPGGSFVFGLLDGKPVFSLPGSPTASIVAFEELVRPSLLKMRGSNTERSLTRPTVHISLGETIRGKEGRGRFVLARVILKDGRLTALPVKKERRGALTPLTRANGIVVLPEGTSEVHEGQRVAVRLLDLDL